MKTNRVLGTLALLAVGAMTAQGALAAGGTITFTGGVTLATCEVENKSMKVQLPTVSSSSLAREGATAGGTPLSMNVACAKAGDGAESRQVRTRFIPANTLDPQTGNLRNLGTAANVQLQVADSTNVTPINLAGSANATPVGTVVNGSAKLAYVVRYYATGAASAGTVNTYVTYDMSYL